MKKPFRATLTFKDGRQLVQLYHKSTPAEAARALMLEYFPVLTAARPGINFPGANMTPPGAELVRYHFEAQLKGAPIIVVQQLTNEEGRRYADRNRRCNTLSRAGRRHRADNAEALHP